MRTIREDFIRQLKQKGWSPEAIERTEAIIKSREDQDKSRSLVFSNKLIFWMILLIFIIANLLISIALIPLVLLVNFFALNFVIIIIGLAVGLLFNFLIGTIENLNRNHYITAIFLLTVFAVVDFLIVIAFTNIFASKLGVSAGTESPIVLGVIYAVSFMFPYIYTLIVKRKI